MNRLSLLFLTLFFFCPWVVFAGDLDNSHWKIHPKGFGFWQSDILKFENNQFTSEECIPYGFKTSSYTSRKEGDNVIWSATQTNDKKEKMEWKGVISQLGKMDGTYLYLKSNGDTEIQSWSGKMTYMSKGK